MSESVGCGYAACTIPGNVLLDGDAASRASALDTAGGDLLIDLSAIARNYRSIRERVAPADCGAVLKADAYGLGAAEIAEVLFEAGCRTFFVAQMNEALTLRRFLARDAEILVLNGVSPGAMPLAMAQSITPVLNTIEQALTWTRLLKGHGICRQVVLQVDTGMTRLGLMQHEVGKFADIAASEKLPRPDLMMSHLASADVPDDNYCEKQREILMYAARHFPGVQLSLANSAGCFLGPRFTFDICRPGAALFGLHVSARTPVLHPVVRLNLRIAQIREVPAGVAIGYGRAFTTNRVSRIATISAGYADGIPRNLTAPAGVWLGSSKMPIVGRVCMDSFMVDASEIEDPRLREDGWVEFIGAHQSLEDLGAASGTIGYEILTRLGNRYVRTAIDPA